MLPPVDSLALMGPVSFPFIVSESSVGETAREIVREGECVCLMCVALV